MVLLEDRKCIFMENVFSVFDVEGKDVRRIPVKHQTEYTPVRRFYAWIGFATIVIVTLHGALLVFGDIL